MENWELVNLPDDAFGDELLAMVDPVTNGRNLNPAQIYLNSLSSKLSRITMRSFLGQVAKMINGRTLETFEWGQLRRHHIQAVQAMLNDAKYAPSTCNTYLSALKGVALEAWNLGYTTAEDFQRIKHIKASRGSRDIPGRALEKSELKALLDACFKTNNSFQSARDAAIFALLAGCGLRRSELVSLNHEHINHTDRSLQVIGKGNKQRNAFVPEFAWKHLTTWSQLQGTKAGPIFVRIRREAALTPDRLTPHAIYNILTKRYILAGLPMISPHDLRRTFATWMLEQDEDIATLMELMGHSQITTTKRYDHRGEQRKRDARDKFSLG